MSRRMSAQAATQSDAEAPRRRLSGVSARAVVVALGMMVGVIFWIHWAELVLGGRRGHTALANTAIPVGAFSALLLLTGLSAILNRLRPGLGLRQKELLVIYAMLAVATVLASSGAIHFLVPGVASAFYFADPANKWAMFQPYIPTWVAPHDYQLLRPYFEGDSDIIWKAWLVPTVVWCSFLFIYALCTICITAIVRAQWIEHERLTFPTVWVPITITERAAPFWRDRIAWIGMAIPFLVGTVNNLHLNYPSVPALEVRNIDLSAHFTARPWSAMGGLSISLYPFVVGIAFLLSSEMTFSCWFFFLMAKLQRIVGASFGLDQWGRGGISVFPFQAHQGAGAFLALAGLAIFVGRKALARGLLAAWRGVGQEEVPRWALVGVCLTFTALIIFTSTMGMSVPTAVALLILSLAYLTAATRIRAETGNAWLFGPEVDPHTLLITGLGPQAFAPRDLTIMAYLASISSFDLRCASMPHQLDAYKISEVAEIDVSAMTRALILGLAFGIPVGWVGALKVWHHVGALAKGEPWRVQEGKHPFELLASYLLAPQPADRAGLAFVGLGSLVTVALFMLRARVTNWPLHPVGYAMANTPSMYNQWFPFLLAWVAKTAVLRYGGHHTYRKAVPFFVGMVVGDLLNGGLYTLMGCFIDSMHVYPVNW